MSLAKATFGKISVKPEEDGFFKPDGGDQGITKVQPVDTTIITRGPGGGSGSAPSIKLI
jgi:hypothetical protein